MYRRSKFFQSGMRWPGNIILFISITFLFFCCTLFQDSVLEYDEDYRTEQINVRRDTEADRRYIEEKFGSIENLQQQLRENAYSLLGKKSLRVHDKKFNVDCVGVVLAVYYLSDVDISWALTRYSGNGVRRLFKSLDNQGLLYETKRPQTGDLIFWDNTYDRNEDSKWNDYLTHVGMVVDMDEHGTIDYIHYNYRKGIVIEKMNLFKPNVHLERDGDKDVVINSPMRMRGSGKLDPNRWLSSQLYRIFGLAYLLKENN